MKFLTFTTVALLLGASHAFAGGGAPVPDEPQVAPRRVVPVPFSMMRSAKPFGA